ncbi:velvet factor-domain-containing protein [Armillaria borealis]|uniref:Velvet factor-domain-containing protein n=1 Tax=Armillaria borealis TaxID=47425 RepID=A0AA39IZQ3_9AGAR|nr:velvet factor-domain-containing protein [Armillaria borealis]KAK0436575.1 velvet factor-domain-containing protein [Armillaria borealis]
MTSTMSTLPPPSHYAQERDRLEYDLVVRQEPKQARMCGVGGKADRRPIDPPPIVQLRVIDPRRHQQHASGSDGRPASPSGGSYAQSFLQNPYYFMFASLAKPDDDAELHWLKDGKTRCTTGSVVSSLYHLKDPQRNNEDAGFFVFPDLSVRTEGSYRLKLSLFEVVGNNVRHCKSIYSAPFYVYTAKKFPGMEESTPLSCSLADQGIKIRIRKDIRVRKRPTTVLDTSRQESDQEDDEEDDVSDDGRRGKHSSKKRQKRAKDGAEPAGYSAYQQQPLGPPPPPSQWNSYQGSQSQSNIDPSLDGGSVSIPPPPGATYTTVPPTSTSNSSIPPPQGSQHIPPPPGATHIPPPPGATHIPPPSGPTHVTSTTHAASSTSPPVAVAPPPATTHISPPPGSHVPPPSPASHVPPPTHETYDSRAYHPPPPPPHYDHHYAPPYGYSQPQPYQYAAGYQSWGGPPPPPSQHPPPPPPHQQAPPPQSAPPGAYDPYAHQHPPHYYPPRYDYPPPPPPQAQHQYYYDAPYDPRQHPPPPPPPPQYAHQHQHYYPPPQHRESWGTPASTGVWSGSPSNTSPSGSGSTAEYPTPTSATREYSRPAEYSPAPPPPAEGKIQLAPLRGPSVIQLSERERGERSTSKGKLSIGSILSREGGA